MSQYVTSAAQTLHRHSLPVNVVGLVCAVVGLRFSQTVFTIIGLATIAFTQLASYFAKQAIVPQPAPAAALAPAPRPQPAAAPLAVPRPLAPVPGPAADHSVEPGAADPRVPDAPPAPPAAPAGRVVAPHAGRWIIRFNYGAAPISIDVAGRESIEEIRRRIHAAGGPEPQLQGLFLSQRQLHDGRTFNCYTAASEGTLVCVLNARSGCSVDDSVIPSLQARSK